MEGDVMKPMNGKTKFILKEWKKDNLKIQLLVCYIRECQSQHRMFTHSI